MNILSCALAYARKGYPVHPLIPGAKNPLLKGGYKSATTDENQIKEWWDRWPTANVGIPMGHVSGLICIDIDIKHEDQNGFESLIQTYGPDIIDDLNSTVQQTTPTSGTHFLFKMCKENVGGPCGTDGLGPGIDIRGNGFYIVVAPSETKADGKKLIDGKYEWILEQGLLDMEPGDLPPVIHADLVKLVDKPKEKSYAIPEKIDDGNRNNELYKFASSLRSKGMSEQEIYASLKIANERCVSKLDDSELSAIAHSASGYEQGSKVRWDRTQSGKLQKTFNNCMNFFEQEPVFKDLFKFNEFSQREEIVKKTPWCGYGEYPRPVINSDLNSIKSFLRMKSFEPSLDTINESIASKSLDNKYHPVLDYLKKLKHDGTPRLKTWLTHYMGAEDNPYTKWVAQMMLVAACARVDQPGCKYDYMVIFEGDQGTGKSQAVQALSEPWFKEVSLTDRDTDTVQKMQGAWIIEVPEMLCFKRQEIESLKSFITTQSDHARFSYKKIDQKYPRQSIFIGTINPENVGYLRDQTGNRRFLPIKTNRINISALRCDKDQLFAEAWLLYQKGFPLYIKDSKIEEYAKNIQKARMETDDWTSLVENYIERTSDELVSALDIYVGALNGSARDFNPFLGRRIGNIMSALGYKASRYKKPNGVRVRGYKIDKIAPWEKE